MIGPDFKIPPSLDLLEKWLHSCMVQIENLVAIETNQMMMWFVGNHLVNRAPPPNICNRDQPVFNQVIQRTIHRRQVQRGQPGYQRLMNLCGGLVLGMFL